MEKISEPKLVIVIRKDLKMRRGKEIAQGSHSACAWMSKLIRGIRDYKVFPTLDLSSAQSAWIQGRFKKICLVVNSEEELLAIHNQALQAGLQSFLITDSGDTEFHGVPTNTCVGIGPDYPENIDPITKDLKLY